MTSTGEWPAQTADGKWVEQVGAHTDWEAGLPEVLQPLLRIWFCGHFNVFGSTPSTSTECEAKLKLLTGEEQILLCQLLFLVNQDRTPSPSHPKEYVDEKESRTTSSPIGTWLPVVPVNSWTNHICPAANLEFFQLQDPSHSDQGWNNSWKQRSFNHILWGRGKQKYWFLQLLKWYEKEKRVRL